MPEPADGALSNSRIDHVLDELAVIKATRAAFCAAQRDMDAEHRVHLARLKATLALEEALRRSPADD
jgi:hypothetical protein